MVTCRGEFRQRSADVFALTQEYQFDYHFPMKISFALFLSLFLFISTASANLFISTDGAETEDAMDIALNDGFVTIGLLQNGKLLADGENGIEVFDTSDSVPVPEGAEFFSAANIDEVPAARRPQVRAALEEFMTRLNGLVGVEGSNVTEADVMEVAVFLASFGLPRFDPELGVFVETPVEDPATEALDRAEAEGQVPPDQDRPELPESIEEGDPTPPAGGGGGTTTTPPVDNNDEYFAPGT